MKNKCRFKKINNLEKILFHHMNDKKNSERKYKHCLALLTFCKLNQEKIDYF